MQNCFICNRHVLEFAGEFNKFDTYLLSSANPEDRAVLDAGAFGYVHATCLVDSPWGAIWAGKWRQHLIDWNGRPLLELPTGEQVFFQSNLNEYLLLQPFGTLVSFRKVDWMQKERFGEGYLVPLLREYNQELSDQASAGMVRNALDRDGKFPLPEYAKIFGLENTFLKPKVVARGELLFSRPLKRYWIGNWISVQISSRVFVTPEIGEYLSTRE